MKVNIPTLSVVQECCIYFKILCHTLAERHQLLQAFYSAGELFPPSIQVDKSVEFLCTLYNREIQHAINNCKFDVKEAIVTDSVTYKGTIYKTGLFVLVRRVDEGLVVGEILLIVVHKSTVYFIVRENKVEILAGLHVNKLTGSLNAVCVTANSLLDYYPLPIYEVKGHLVIPCTPSYPSFLQSVNHGTRVDKGRCHRVKYICSEITRI